MAGETTWNELELWRLLEDVLQHCPSTDEDYTQAFLWYGRLEDVTQLDAAARDQEYEDAFDRAFATARRTQATVAKDLARRERALELLAKPASRNRPFFRYQGSPLANAFLHLSNEARHRDPKEMLYLAERGCREAEIAAPEDYPPGVVFDLRARAFTDIANAYRVNERYRDADLAFGRAIEYLAVGSGDLGLVARLRDVEASLRMAQRRLPEALDLLDEAHRLYLEIGDCHLAGRTLVSRAFALQTTGDPAQAVRTLEKAEPLLDAQRDPALITASTTSLISNLVDCGEFRRAGELLLESGLREKFADQPLNLLRLRWVEAKIHAGMDRLDRAEVILAEVRAGFRQRDLEYDAALAGLDLAVIWLRQGQADQLLPLAIEMSQTFNRLELPTKEAAKAVTFLLFACRRQAVSIPFVERTRDFLARFQADPSLRFDPASTFQG